MSNPKPIVRNPDGNIFYILGACNKALAATPAYLKAFKEETKVAMTDGTDYDGMLRLCMKYVDFQITDEGEEKDEDSYTEDDDIHLPE
jgi:hypothetical protein